MFKARYYKADGKKGSAITLPDAVFDGVVHEGVLHQVVKAYLANQRQGTASAKNRSAVAGGSRKPWRQKGTGRARQGTIRAAQWSGGGRAFPPIPHSWRQRLPKKVKALARRSAFNARAEEDRVVVIDRVAMEAPKTRQVRSYLEQIELGGQKILILTDGVRQDVYLSARNLPRVEVRTFGQESPYDILWAGTVVIEKEALDSIGQAPAKVDEPVEIEEPVEVVEKISAVAVEEPIEADEAIEEEAGDVEPGEDEEATDA